MLSRRTAPGGARLTRQQDAVAAELDSLDATGILGTRKLLCTLVDERDHPDAHQHGDHASDDDDERLLLGHDSLPASLHDEKPAAGSLKRAEPSRIMTRLAEKVLSQVPRG